CARLDYGPSFAYW
nr:immunoglobulin heavy chain junction region [Mus musculus]